MGITVFYHGALRDLGQLPQLTASVYGLDAEAAPVETAADQNDELPRIVCSESLRL